MTNNTRTDRSSKSGFRLGSCWTASLLALAGLSLLPAAASAGDWTSKDGYIYYSTPSAPAPGQKIALKDKASTPSFVLMGGGPDVDQAFRWMIERAGVRPASAGKPATGGRFVIVRARGADGYNPYLYYSTASLQTDQPAADDWVGGAQLGLSSVETLVIPDRAAANSDFVNQVVRSANAVFIAGGDQSDYIREWKRTKLEASLLELMKNKVPIGGTSAGLAVLGQFDFAALRGSVTSTQALADPFNKYMTLDPSPMTLTQYMPSDSQTYDAGFLTPSPLFNIVFDSHLDSRDRLGRLVSFVARQIGGGSWGDGCPGGILNPGMAAKPGSTDLYARGVGISVETALLVAPNGSGQLIAQRVTNANNQDSASKAFFVSAGKAPSQCAPGLPLSMPAVRIVQVDAANPTFNLSTWSGGLDLKPLDVTQGVMNPAGTSFYTSQP